MGLLLVVLAPSSSLAADARPRLAVALLDETRYEGSVRLQAVAVNRLLKTLGDLFPELDMDVGPTPSRRADYRLSLRSMQSSGTFLEIEAQYEAGGEASGDHRGIFTEGCSGTDADRGRCTRSSMDQRAEQAVADLLNKTVLHWEHGIYKLVEVRRCQSLPYVGVALQVTASSTVTAYKEPSDKFDYSASVLVKVFGSDPYPVPRDLVLRRSERVGNGYAFSRLLGRPDQLDELCSLQQEWVLLHRYQRLELPARSEASEPAGSLVAINSAAPNRSEER